MSPAHLLGCLIDKTEKIPHSFISMLHANSMSFTSATRDLSFKTMKTKDVG